MNLEYKDQLSLKSERFMIRPLREEDVTPAYLSWFSDPDVLAHIISAPSMNTLDHVRNYVRAKQGLIDTLLMGIFILGSGQHIGNIKFEPILWDKGEAVVGVLIGERSWRAKGVFRETFEACTNEFVKSALIRQYWLGVDDDNLFALKAYQRAGFVIEKPPAHLFPDIRQGVRYMHLSVASRTQP